MVDEAHFCCRVSLHVKMILTYPPNPRSLGVVQLDLQKKLGRQGQTERSWQQKNSPNRFRKPPIFMETLKSYLETYVYIGIPARMPVTTRMIRSSGEPKQNRFPSLTNWRNFHFLSYFDRLAKLEKTHNKKQTAVDSYCFATSSRQVFDV